MSDLVPLRNHILIQKGKAPLVTGYLGPDAKPYLNPEYLRGRANAELAKAGADALYACDGDTVLLWDGSNAGEFFRAKSGLVASTMAKITHSSHFTPSYFFHVMKHAENYVKSKTNGTGIPHVDRELLEGIRVYCPGAKEQKRVAEILDHIDIAIHETETIIAKLKAVKQGLLHDLLTRGIDANGELRPPQAEAPHSYKGSPLGWIPKDWEEVTLGEIARRSGGFLQTGPFGSQLHAHEYVLDGIPVIMPQDMVNGELSTESIAQISPRKAVTLSRHRVQLNDVVFSRRGDLSLCVAIEEKHLGWLCGTGCLLARLPCHEINGYWLALVYPQPGLQTQVMGRAVGSTMANLNTSILAAITIARPPIAEQEEISKRLKSVGKRIRQEEEGLKKRRSEKIGLMDDLLTGRVSVAALIQNNGDLDG